MLRRSVILLVLCLISLLGSASDHVKKEALELIEQTQQQLDQQELKKNQQLAQLRQLELDRMKLESERDQLTKSLILSKSAYTGIDKVNQQMRKRLDDQLSLLEKLTLLAYVQYKESPIKILYYLDDVDQWYRNLAYYKYTTDYQLAQLAETDANLQIQNKLLKELIDTKKIIEQQQEMLDQRLASLKITKINRKNLIAKLSSQILVGEQRIDQLNKQFARIDSLTSELGSLQVDELLIGDVSFRSLHGQLPMPTEGITRQTFTVGADIGKQSTLHHKGMVIEAKYGAPVIAIARGNVVYTDWLGGFGLVIILDHGDDYLSLYAHNRQLNKRIGDWVNPGEIISYVGETGGQKKPQLYFELRHKSVAINPQNWLVSS